MTRSRLVMITNVESAIVLLVPEAQPVLESAGTQTGTPPTSMPAHVTLLYPFAPDPDPGVVEELRFFFAGVDGFPLTFSKTDEFPDVLYLAPDQSSECQNLTDAIARRWPDFPPYKGEFGEVVPHLTVIRGADATVRAHVEELLPVQTQVCEASLWVRDTCPWRQLASFPMGPPEP